MVCATKGRLPEGQSLYGVLKPNQEPDESRDKAMQALALMYAAMHTIAVVSQLAAVGGVFAGVVWVVRAMRRPVDQKAVRKQLRMR